VTVVRSVTNDALKVTSKVRVRDIAEPILAKMMLTVVLSHTKYVSQAIARPTNVSITTTDITTSASCVGRRKTVSSRSRNLSLSSPSRVRNHQIAFRFLTRLAVLRRSSRVKQTSCVAEVVVEVHFDSKLVREMSCLHCARLGVLLGLMVASTLAFVVPKGFGSPFGLIRRSEIASDR
jgi:hypothetical protein